MKSCLFCSQNLKYDLSLNTIFSFHALKNPLACQRCLDTFQRINSETACAGCSRQQTKTAFCEDCKKWQIFSPEIKPDHRSLFVYNDIARQYMSDFKFQGDVHLAKLWGDDIHHFLKPYTKTHVLTVIPASQSSYQKRGFNQVELLLKYANIAYNPLIKHVKDTALQSSQTRSERLKSVQPFELISPEGYDIIKKPVLIIDDVYTTGRTIFHARELLQTAVSTASMTLFR